MNINNFFDNKYTRLSIAALFLAALYFISLRDYLLFHSIAEIFSIVVAFGIFIVTWNSRRLRENNYFLFLGVAYLFIAALDLIHTLAYKGMGVFPGYGANLATQLWLAARYMQAAALFAAPFLLSRQGRKIRSATMIFICGGAAALLLLAIFYWKIFPLAYIEGYGLTPLKKISEYFIAAVMLGALVPLLQKRKEFDKNVLRLLLFSIIISAASEISFTFYNDPYGVFNAAGHLLKIIAFYLIYQAVVVTGIKNPYNLLFRNLKQSEETLRYTLYETKRQQTETAALFQGSQAILKYRNFKNSSRAIFNVCKKLVGAHSGYAALFNQGNKPDEILFFENNGRNHPQNADFWTLLKETHEKISQTGQPIYDNDFSQGKNNDSLLGKNIKINNILLIPLTIEQKTVGVLSFFNKDDGFARKDIQVATTFGELSSVALNNNQARASLEHSEQRLRSVTQTANDAIISSDNKGRIVFWNQAAETIFGYKAQEAIGKPLTMIMPKCFHGGHNEAFARAVENQKLRNKNSPVEIYGLKKDGGEFPLELSTAQWQTEEGIFFTGIIRDITERKKSQDSLQKSEQKYRDIVETSQEGIWIVDAQKKITYANQRMAEMIGYKADEITGRSVFDFVAAEEETFIQTNPERRLRGTREKRLRRKNGEVFWALESISPSFDADGRHIGAMEMMIDITRRKTAEEEKEKLMALLKKEKAEDEALLSSIGHGVVAINKQRKILFSNKIFAGLIGWPENELIGKDLPEIMELQDDKGNIIPFEKRPIALALLAPNNKKSITNNTSWFVAKNRSKTPVAITAAPVALEGKNIGAIAVFRNIAKEKEVDRAKTEFVSLASHQLRTPLTSVSLAAEMLVDGIAGKVSNEQKKYLKDIYGGVKAMSALIESLLNVSRIEMGTLVIKPEPTNLCGFIDSLIKEMELQMKNKKIKLRKNCDKDLPLVNIDRPVMRLVLENLLSNALKYTPKNGSITVEIKKQEGEAIIQVSDTGCGIPANQQSRVFTKLFRADNKLKDKTKGTGLGLYIVKAAAAQYGGRVWFESKENEGTTFYVTVPLKGMKAKLETSEQTK